jgi:hypothetical protein
MSFSIQDVAIIMAKETHRTDTNPGRHLQHPPPPTHTHTHVKSWKADWRFSEGRCVVAILACNSYVCESWSVKLKLSSGFSIYGIGRKIEMKYQETWFHVGSFLVYVTYSCTCSQQTTLLTTGQFLMLYVTCVDVKCLLRYLSVAERIVDHTGSASTGSVHNSK